MEVRIHENRKATEGERVLVEVESASRPGATYRVHLFGKDGRYCPCPGFDFSGERRMCRHIVEARIRTAPYRIERVHNSIIGGYEYTVIEQATGRIEGCQPSYGDAFALVRELTGLGEVA